MVAEFNKVIDTIEGKNFVHKVVEFFVDRSREKNERQCVQTTGRKSCKILL